MTGIRAYVEDESTSCKNKLKVKILLENEKKGNF
jgi:hypothetical protein